MTILPALDAEGYVVEPLAWTEDLARVLAEREGIALTDQHWDVIRFMRRYYETARSRRTRVSSSGASWNARAPSRGTGSSSSFPAATRARPAASPA